MLALLAALLSHKALPSFSFLLLNASLAAPQLRLVRKPARAIRCRASPSLASMSQGDPARQQALADQHHQHLDADGLQLHGASYSQQQQQGSQDIAPPQLDMLSQQLHQVLVADTTRFWSATVGPSAQSIFQGTMVLQKEAADLSNRAGVEMQELMTELNRVHHLVASFQDQIRETLSLLQG